MEFRTDHLQLRRQSCLWLTILKTTQAHTSPRRVQMHNMLHRKWKCLGTVCNRDRLECGECTYHITIELAGTV